jgi:hypothetical protein
VEPKYEKKLETSHDLLDSDAVYGYYPALNFDLATVPYPQLMMFIENKKLKEDCSEVRKCVERMITKRDVASFMDPALAHYFAMKMGTVDVIKIICSLDENSISAGIPVLFKKGNPLLDRFKILMRMYLEAGLMESLWTELQHRASLRAEGEFREAAGDVFFAFSVSHLKSAFVVLLVGTVLSSVVFIVELTVNWLCKRRERNKSWVRRVRRLY